MAPRSRTQAKRRIESYDHRDRERFNDSPVGTTSGIVTGTRYAYDPNVDPKLHWAGENEDWARLVNEQKADIDKAYSRPAGALRRCRPRRAINSESSSSL